MYPIAMPVSFCVVFLICVFMPGTTEIPMHVVQVCVFDSEPVAAVGVLST